MATVPSPDSSESSTPILTPGSSTSSTALPFRPSTDISSNQAPKHPLPLGHTLRPHFLFSPTYMPLNHGSFGAFPRPVQRALHTAQASLESAPDTFFRYVFPSWLDENRAAVAKLVKAPVNEIVLVPNVTTATNEVLRNIQWQDGDVVVYFDTVYGAVEKLVKYMEETTPLRGLKIGRSLPVEDDELIEAFEKAVKGVNEDHAEVGKAVKGTPAKKRKVRMALFDTICSMPGVRVPWERMVEKCRDFDVLSCVDGAHGIGHIPLNLGEVQPDFFMSNLHKWLYVPRGCALFYVPQKNQHLIRSALPTSHGFAPLPSDEPKDQIFNPLPQGANTRFVLLHEFVATLDPSPYLCVQAAINFRETYCGGEERIMKYCSDLATAAGFETAKVLGTNEIMENAAGTLTEGCALVSVRMPLDMGDGEGQVPEKDKLKVGLWIQERGAKDFETYFAISVYDGKWYVRWSGQIYLELEDFVWGAGVLKELCERVKKGEYKE
ncbi:hypothetical protein MMC25_002873 [Agyrium rufum]|nr:hypothetical protein [Agyrium rufum]